MYAHKRKIDKRGIAHHMEPKSNTHTHALTTAHARCHMQRWRRRINLLTEWSRRHQELISKDWHGDKLAESRWECRQIPWNETGIEEGISEDTSGWGVGGEEARGKTDLRFPSFYLAAWLSCGSFAKQYQVPDFDLWYSSILSGGKQEYRKKSVREANTKKCVAEIKQLNSLLSSPRGTDRGIKTEMKWLGKMWELGKRTFCFGWEKSFSLLFPTPTQSLLCVTVICKVVRLK